jgi:hypothetical protein
MAPLAEWLRRFKARRREHRREKAVRRADAKARLREHKEQRWSGGGDG